MKLYLLTNGLGEWYIVSNTWNNAVDILEKSLYKLEYCLRERRKVTNIKLLSNEIETENGKLKFYTGNNLILDK